MTDVVRHSREPATEHAERIASADDHQVGPSEVAFIVIGTKECAPALADFPSEAADDRQVGLSEVDVSSIGAQALAEALAQFPPEPAGDYQVELAAGDASFIGAEDLAEALAQFPSEATISSYSDHPLPGLIDAEDVGEFPSEFESLQLSGRPARRLMPPLPLISSVAIARPRIPMLAVASFIGLVLITAGMAVQTFVFSASGHQPASSRLQDTTIAATPEKPIPEPREESITPAATTAVTAVEDRSDPDEPPPPNLTLSRRADISVPPRSAPDTTGASPLPARGGAVTTPPPASLPNVPSLADSSPPVVPTSAPTPAPSATVARLPDLRGDDAASGLTASAEAARVVRETVPAAAVPAGLPASVAPTVTPRGAIQRTLDRYQAAFSTLDAEAVRGVWPTADVKALARAFEQLQEETLRFDACEVTVSGPRATASCGGTMQYVPRVGGKTPRVDRHRWRLSLREAANGWVIDSIEVGR